MDTKNIAERLRKIAAVADMCWIDGDKCLYGFPNGRFQDRPVQICHLGDGGCKRLSVFAEFIEEFTGNFIQKVIGKIIQKEQVSLSSELKVIAEDLLSIKTEQEVLKLAADIIKVGKCDRIIVRVNDIDIDENIY